MSRSKRAAVGFCGCVATAGVAHLAQLGLIAQVSPEGLSAVPVLGQLAFLLVGVTLAAVQAAALFCAVVGPIAVLAGKPRE